MKFSKSFRAYQSWISRTTNASSNPKPPALEHIWVDLTPMLKGGANGGAKPFILTLLQELAKHQPKVLFHCTCKPELVGDLQPLGRDNLIFSQSMPAVAAGRLLGSRRLGRHSRDLLYKLLACLSSHPKEAGASNWSSRANYNDGAGAQLLLCPFGAPLLHRAGLTTVCTFYDLQVLAYPDFFSATTRSERLEHFRKMLAKASRIAAISDFSRQEAIEHGADPGRIRTITIRTALSRYTARVEQPPFELVSGRFFLYPANLWRHKNHELLLTAFAMARQQGLPQDHNLVCTGDGVGRLDELKKLAAGLHLSENVLLPGFVEETDLEGLYQHSLAVLFPSLYEGYGMPVIEAMARGIPVACSNTTALAEITGDAAILFHPGNPQQIATSMLRLTREPELRQFLSQQGLKQAGKYAQAAEMAQQYWDLLLEAHAAGPVD